MNNKFKSIKLYYFDACPSWKESLTSLREALKEMGYEDNVDLIRVETYEDALSNKFTGSPTIKVNDKDIFPTKQENYALGCRVYKTPEGFKGSPTKEMLKQSLFNFIKK